MAGSVLYIFLPIRSIRENTPPNASMIATIPHMIIVSLFITDNILSIIIGGFAFCCLWGILEMFMQEKRVLRGWFPENPKRREYYAARRKEMKNKL